MYLNIFYRDKAKYVINDQGTFFDLRKFLVKTAPMAKMINKNELWSKKKNKNILF